MIFSIASSVASNVLASRRRRATIDLQKLKFQRVKIVYCIACGINPVDYYGGYEICPDCIGKL